MTPDGTFWIGSDHPFDLAEAYLNFRRDIVLHNTPETASFTLTADSRYRLWINGTYVARGPSRAWPHAMQTDAIDVTKHLRAGPNHLAIQTYSPGYSHFAHVHRAATGWLGWLNIDGEITPSDRHWHVQRDASWSPLVPRISIYGTGVERRDMARDTDWQTGPTDTWSLPRIVQPPDGPIYTNLHPRDVPMLAERALPLTLPWQTRYGPTPAPTDDPHQDLRTACVTCPPAEIPATLQANQTAIWIFDLTHSQICVGAASLQTATGGETLTISYAEKLRPAKAHNDAHSDAHSDAYNLAPSDAQTDGATQDPQILLSDPDTYCRMRPTDRTTLRPGPQIVEPFSQRGARYLIFRLDTVATMTPDIQFFARLTTYPLEEIPLKPQPDPTLDAVAQMCRRTIIACLQDGFVDSIWRESSQWLGDVVAEAFALQAISHDARPLARAINMAAAGAAPDGILPSVLPADVPAYVVTDYNFSWIELLDLYTKHPGATDGPQMIATHRATLEKLLARLHADVGRNGLIRSQPGRRLFLDWSGVSRAEPNLTYNARYLHALQTAARLTSNPRGHMQATALRDAVRSRFCNTHWHETPQGPPASQLALALLILTDAVTGPEAEALSRQITARSLDLDDTSAQGKLILASPFMHHYIFQALDHLGQQAQIRAIIAARWGRWANAGEPTTWENWNIDFPDGSACHGFSAHPLGWLTR